MQNDILQLSKTRSVLRIPVSWDVLRKIPDVVTVDVKWIENPALAPVMLGVYFESAVIRWDVGVFTLYPPDHPGVFKFRITDIVKNMLASPPGLESQQLFFCVALRQARS